LSKAKMRRKRERNEELQAERAGLCECGELRRNSSPPNRCLVGPRAAFDALTIDGPPVEVVMRCRVTGLTWRVYAYRERQHPEFGYALTAQGLERAYALEREGKMSFPEDRLRELARQLER
jgi:hypothetical protein